MITRSSAARTAAIALVAGTLLLGASGCGFITPTATLTHYDPSDGVSATVGDVRVLNMIGVINKKGDAVSLVASIVNTGKSAQVTFQFESGGEKHTVKHSVPSGATVTFGTADSEADIIVENPEVIAGSLLSVYVQHGDVTGQSIAVPVLEATGPYATLAPPSEH